MTPGNWAHVRRHLERLLELEIAGRSAYLDKLDDADLRAELQDLLAQQAPTDVSSAFGDNGEVRSSRVANRYRVERLLGRGGMGEVHLAFDEQLKRRVALKRVRFDRRGRDAAMHRLRREAEANAALVHPHIATLYDVLSSGDEAVLVEEYVDGATLESLIAAGTLSTDDVLTYTRQLLSAMSHAHDAGVVHCDLKPGNLMVTRARQIKVLDFGIATVATGAASTDTGNTTRHVVCTPRYAAPEVLRGRTPSAAADVYAIGLIVRECLESVEGGARGRSARPLRQLVNQATLPERSRRQPTARHMVEQLDRFSSQRAWRVASPTGTVSVLTGFAVFALTGLVAPGRQGSDGAGDAATTQQVIAVVVQRDPSVATNLSFGMADLVASQLAGTENVTLVASRHLVDGPMTTASYSEFAADGVTHLVVPVVRDLGTTIRCTLRLVDARTGLLQWVRTHQAGTPDIVALQEKLSRDLAAHLKLARPPQLKQRSTFSIEALRALSDGRELYADRNRPGYLDAAIDAYRRAYRVAPDLAIARAQLAVALIQRGLVQLSADDIEEARNLVSDLDEDGPPYLWYAKAILSYRTGEFADATAAVTLALSVDPLDEQTLRLWAVLRAESGDTVGALEAIDVAIARRPGHWEYVNQKGEILLAAGDLHGASQSFAEARDLAPRNSWPVEFLGSTAVSRADYVEAQQLFSKAIELQPTAAAFEQQALLAMREGRWHDADDAASRARAINPARLSATLLHARVLLALGRAHEARQLAQRVVELTHMHRKVAPARLDHIGALQLARGLLGEAVEVNFERASAASGQGWSDGIVYLAVAVADTSPAQAEALVQLGLTRQAGWRLRSEPALDRFVNVVLP